MTGATVQVLEINADDYCLSDSLGDYVLVGKPLSGIRFSCETHEGKVVNLPRNDLHFVMSNSRLQDLKRRFIVHVEGEQETIELSRRDRTLERLHQPWPLDRPLSAGANAASLDIFYRFVEVICSQEETELLRRCIFGRS